MTRHGALALTAAAGLLAAGAATAWPAGDGATATRPARPALVVDAALGRPGRELIDPRLRGAGVAIRLPRTVREARTDVRYLIASGHAPVVVAGPRSSAVVAPGTRRAATLAAALTAVRRAGR
ncbi:MAG: hypothetical protein ACXVFT_01600 [Solirubrobacteraceae bacterium]